MLNGRRIVNIYTHAAGAAKYLKMRGEGKLRVKIKNGAGVKAFF